VNNIDQRGEQQQHGQQARTIVVRPFAFDFPATLSPRWNAAHIVRSHLFNGFSLTMPYVEPFMIKVMQDLLGQIQSPALAADIRAFNAQEARHSECHRRYNELVKANGYPQMAAIEARLAATYKRLAQRSLRSRLAFTLGFETATNGFTAWLISRRRHLFGEACPYVASFWLMHMVEETEHKNVAYDAYMACDGAYLPRAVGVVQSALHLLSFAFATLVTALRKDGELFSMRRLAETVVETGSLLRHLAPPLLRALMPGYNPRHEPDPQWMTQWVAGYATMPAGALLPLVDTHSAELPVPFERAPPLSV
jgi:predicted metal-dependent hydrolase